MSSSIPEHCLCLVCPAHEVCLGEAWVCLHCRDITFYNGTYGHSLLVKAAEIERGINIKISI